ncbi:MAG: gas vesicle protein K, partial [Methylococcus sp.]
MNANDLPSSAQQPAENPKPLPLLSAVENSPMSPHLAIDGDKVRNGLAQLVLTLVKLLHELLERQAIRRMDSGTLTDEEIEKLGQTLMRQG